METEIEAKFPHVDPEILRARLNELGAKLVHPEVQMCRHVFDYQDKRLEKIGGWVRIRQENDKVTMSYKQLNDRTLHGTKEITIIVDDYDKAHDFLTSIGLVSHAYQETTRETWLYKDVEVTIDTWPWIPTFMELEGPSEELVREVASDLNFDWDEAMHGSVETVYQMHYDFTEIEIDNWAEIKFCEPPEWLLAKKKN
ncbi:MAG: class IV adenylate cyclase [Patescibacteria group bacterium]